jgi:hypothetical protein
MARFETVPHKDFLVAPYALQPVGLIAVLANLNQTG